MYVTKRNGKPPNSGKKAHANTNPVIYYLDLRNILKTEGADTAEGNPVEPPTPDHQYYLQKEQRHSVSLAEIKKSYHPHPAC